MVIEEKNTMISDKGFFKHYLNLLLIKKNYYFNQLMTFIFYLKYYYLLYL